MCCCASFSSEPRRTTASRARGWRVDVGVSSLSVDALLFGCGAALLSVSAEFRDCHGKRADCSGGADAAIEACAAGSGPVGAAGDERSESLDCDGASSATRQDMAGRVGGLRSFCTSNTARWAFKKRLRVLLRRRPKAAIFLRSACGRSTHLTSESRVDTMNIWLSQEHIVW